MISKVGLVSTQSVFSLSLSLNVALFSCLATLFSVQRGHSFPKALRFPKKERKIVLSRADNPISSISSKEVTDYQ